MKYDGRRCQSGDRTGCQVQVGSDHIVSRSYCRHDFCLGNRRTNLQIIGFGLLAWADFAGTWFTMSLFWFVISAPTHENIASNKVRVCLREALSATCGMPTILIVLYWLYWYLYISKESIAWVIRLTCEEIVSSLLDNRFIWSHIFFLSCREVIIFVA